MAEGSHEAVLPLERQRLPDRTGQLLAHRVIQASARPRTAPGNRVSGIRRILANYQRCLVWHIELFFKWIKQHLRIKRFFGNSQNAVKTRIWIAVAAYLLVVIMRKRLNLDLSLHAILQILSVTPFEKPPLFQLLSELQAPDNVPHDDNQLILL